MKSQTFMRRDVTPMSSPRITSKNTSSHGIENNDDEEYQEGEYRNGQADDRDEVEMLLEEITKDFQNQELNSPRVRNKSASPKMTDIHMNEIEVEVQEEEEQISLSEIHQSEGSPLKPDVARPEDENPQNDVNSRRDSEDLPDTQVIETDEPDSQQKLAEKIPDEIIEETAEINSNNEEADVVLPSQLTQDATQKDQSTQDTVKDSPSMHEQVSDKTSSGEDESVSSNRRRSLRTSANNQAPVDISSEEEEPVTAKRRRSLRPRLNNKADIPMLDKTLPPLPMASLEGRRRTSKDSTELGEPISKAKKRKSTPTTEDQSKTISKTGPKSQLPESAPRRRSQRLSDSHEPSTETAPQSKRTKIQHPSYRPLTTIFENIRRRSAVPPTLASLDAANRDEDSESSGDEGVFSLTVYKVPKSQGGTTHINAIDIVCASIDAVFEKFKPSFAASKPRPAVLAALAQLQLGVRNRLIGLVDLLDSNHVLAQHLRAAKAKRDSLRDRLLQLREERLKVQQDIEAVRQRHAEQSTKLTRVRELDFFLNDLEAARDMAKSAARAAEGIEDLGNRHETDSPADLVNNVLLDLDLLKPVLGSQGALQALEHTAKRLEYLDQNLAFS